MEMGKSFKRALAWLLMAAMLIAYVPVAAAEADAATEGSVSVEENASEENAKTESKYVEGKVYTKNKIPYVYHNGKLVKLTRELAQKLGIKLTADQLAAIDAQTKSASDEAESAPAEAAPAPAAPAPAPETKVEAPKEPAVEQPAQKADDAQTPVAPVAPEGQQVAQSEPEAAPADEVKTEPEQGTTPEDGTQAAPEEEEAPADETPVAPEQDAEPADQAENNEENNEESAVTPSLPGVGLPGIKIAEVERTVDEDGNEQVTVTPVTPDFESAVVQPSEETDAQEGDAVDGGIALLSLVSDANDQNGRCMKSPNGKHVWTMLDQKTEYTAKTPVKGDKANHTATATITATLKCNICGKPETVISTDENVLQAHDWKADGTCACGAKISDCKHEYTYIVRWIEPDYDKKVETTSTRHTVTGSIVEAKLCKQCGAELSRSATAKKKITGEHEFIRGNCIVCHYDFNCGHSDVTIEKVVMSNSGITKNATSHTYQGATIYLYRICNDCGSNLDYNTPILSNEETLTEGHLFVKNVCIFCGYENKCEHKGGKHTDQTYDLIYNAKSNGDKTHTFYADVTTYKYCDDCGELLSQTTKKDRKVTKNHRFSRGHCTLCGANQEQVVEAETEYRSDEMVTMVIETLQREQVNLGVKTTIAGTEQVLTDAEMVRYDALTPAEKALVTFAAIGMETDTAFAKRTMGLALSPSASALLSDIKLRQSAMTAEEKTALEATIAQYFPVEYNAGIPSVTVTLNVTNAGTTSEQHCTFRRDSALGIWLFVKMETVTQTNG